MNVLIVGYGQIGRSLEELYIDTYTDLKEDLKDLKTTSKVDKRLSLSVGKDLKKSYKKGVVIYKKDLYNTLEGINEPPKGCGIDLMHVSFGYGKDFVQLVTDYITLYKPKLTIIHSTVQINTTREIIDRTGAKVVYSPVMGIHPHLTESMLIFTKIIGGLQKEAVSMARKHFTSLGINTIVFNTPEEAEAAKLLDTSYYGWNILYMKHVNKYCKDRELDFENVYTTTNDIYNEGYTKMKMTNVVRPVLKYMPGKIGGHCVVPNFEILKKEFYPAQLGLEMNEDGEL